MAVPKTQRGLGRKQSFGGRTATSAPGWLGWALAAAISGCASEPSAAPDGWRGRSSQELRAGWGEPTTRALMSSGRQVWCYAHPPPAPGYYVDEVREARRSVSSADGSQHDEIVHEIYPVRREPAQADDARASLRLKIAHDGRIGSASPDAAGCAAASDDQPVLTAGVDAAH